jgi:hypothetical protein
MGERRYRVYVIRLKNSVWDRSARYRKANPSYEAGRPHVYVGSTALSAEERFAKHHAGGKGTNAFVHRFGKRLMPKEYERLPTFAVRADAERLEAEIAETYRRRGWGVWYNADAVGPRLRAPTG